MKAAAEISTPKLNHDSLKDITLFCVRLYLVCGADCLVAPIEYRGGPIKSELVALKFPLPEAPSLGSARQFKDKVLIKIDPVSPAEIKLCLRFFIKKSISLIYIKI